MVNQLKKYFPIKGGLMSARPLGQVKAVDGVTFNLKRGHHHGSGRRVRLRQDPPPAVPSCVCAGEKTGGQVLFNGKEVYDLTAKEMRDMRTKMQIIFQDPFSSLSPASAGW